MGVFHDSKWLTVCKCGNGHDMAAIDRINKGLAANMVVIGKNKQLVPAWLEVHGSLIPDFVVKDPRLSPVWEITGAEFSASSKHTAVHSTTGKGMSIRFPRCTRERDDKSTKQATDLKELQFLFDK